MSRSVLTFLAALAWLAGCGGDDGGTSALEADAARADDGGLCEPFASTVCSDGDAYWQDSCGNRQVIVEECVSPRTCVDERGRCCSPPGSTQVYAGAPKLARVNYIWPSDEVAELIYRFHVTELDFQASGKHQALRTNAAIDGKNFRFGLSTHVSTTLGLGTGLIFSCYVGSEDGARAQLGDDAELVTRPDQGGLLSIRRLVDYGAGSVVTLRVKREEQREGFAQDWFALYYTLDVNAEQLIGRCAFDRENAASPASMSAAGSLWSRVGGLDPDMFTPETLPRFGARVELPSYDGEPASGATLGYPNLPETGEPFPNVDVTYLLGTQDVEYLQGSGVGQCGRPGTLF